MFALQEIVEAIMAFVASGGVALLFIAGLTFFMWTLMLERIWYYHGGLNKDLHQVLQVWEDRPERTSWNAHQIRSKLISEVTVKVNRNLDLIATCVMVCPLLGLFGTVTGMIQVFEVLAITGGGDAKQMAGGVSMATVPTMAGMVAALSGVFANTYVKRIADREKQLLEDHLTMDH